MNAASPANRTACSRMYGVNGTAGKRTGGKVLGNVIVSPSKCRRVAVDIARPPRSVGEEYALDVLEMNGAWSPVRIIRSGGRPATTRWRMLDDDSVQRKEDR